MYTDNLASLLRYALWDLEPQSIKYNGTEWQDLYHDAVRHAVQGHLYDSMMKLPSFGLCPEPIRVRLEADVKAIEQGWSRISAVAVTQQKAWQSRGINAIEIKGRTTAALYPIPEHRVCGDIDWWMPTQHDWDAALQAVKDNGLTAEYDSDGGLRYCLGGIIVEHHRKGLDAGGAEGMLLLLNKHLMHHAMGAGAGMRQLCDYVVAWDRYTGQYDRGAYLKMLKRGRMLRWNNVLEDLADGFRYGGAMGRKASRLYRMLKGDGNFGLDKKKRFAGIARRSLLFLQISPVSYMLFGAGLIKGKVLRKFRTAQRCL